MTLISSSLSLVTYDDDIHSVEWTSYIISVAMMCYILIIVAVAMVRVLRAAIAILSQSPHHIHSRMRLAVCCWYHHPTGAIGRQDILSDWETHSKNSVANVYFINGRVWYTGTFLWKTGHA